MGLSGAVGESLGHLGLIGAAIRDLGVIEKIDELLGFIKGDGVGYGHRVAAMILNGLGFVDTPLYMTPRFFHDKPLLLLLGKEIAPESLNDDCLGRCLDKIADYGVTKWYSELAFKILHEANLLSNTFHIDSTTLSLHGNYTGNENNNVLIPCHGYSKDHRPDLKQVTLQCVSMGKEAFPVWMESLNGNSSDKAAFPESIRKFNVFYKNLTEAPSLRFIADSALYGPELESLDVEWVTRVPETSTEAKSLCALSNVEWTLLSDCRYQAYPYNPKNKKERWLLIRSDPAYEREAVTFLSKHMKNFDSLQKKLWHCSCQDFNCEKDADKEIKKIIGSFKRFYFVDYRIISEAKFSKKGRPTKGAQPDRYVYKVEILGIASDYKAVQDHKDTLGRFILATNVTDESTFSNDAMLSEYKDQSGVEAGFKFIKNDVIGLDDVYLKKPNRIAALMAIMTLCLLIYGITQHRLRSALKENNEFLPDRKSKPTQTPTLIWIFTLFSSISIVKLPPPLSDQRIILNLQPFHEKVICLLGKTAKQIYSIPPERSQKDIILNQKNWLKWCGM